MEGWPAHLRVVGQAVTDWWDDLVNLAIINVIWVLCWFTVILGPPATLGMYHIANRLAHGESLGPRGLWDGGRRYFLQSWLLVLLNLAAVAIILLNFWFYASVEDTWADLVKAFFVLLGVGWLVVQFYALPYLMEQERKNVGLALRNGLFNALAAPGYTLFVFAFAGLVVVLSVGLVFPLLMGGPCLVAIVGNHAVMERLETYGVRERGRTPDENEIPKDNNST